MPPSIESNFSALDEIIASAHKTKGLMEKVAKRRQISMGAQRPHNFPDGSSSPEAPTESARMVCAVSVTMIPVSYSKGPLFQTYAILTLTHDPNPKPQPE